MILFFNLIHFKLHPLHSSSFQLLLCALLSFEANLLPPNHFLKFGYTKWSMGAKSREYGLWVIRYRFHLITVRLNTGAFLDCLGGRALSSWHGCFFSKALSNRSNKLSYYAPSIILSCWRLAMWIIPCLFQKTVVYVFMADRYTLVFFVADLPGETHYLVDCCMASVVLWWIHGSSTVIKRLEAGMDCDWTMINTPKLSQDFICGWFLASVALILWVASSYHTQSIIQNWIYVTCLWLSRTDANTISWVRGFCSICLGLASYSCLIRVLFVSCHIQ